MDRRIFMKSLTGLTAGVMLTNSSDSAQQTVLPGDKLGKLLPTRKLGKTGEAVTMLGVGGWHIGRMNEKEAQKTIEIAIKGGVRFFDSAESYQDGGSESRLGKLLVPKYRDQIFIMTKSAARDAGTAKQHLDASRKRLKTDQLDLWQVHNVTSAQDVDQCIQNGVFDVMQEAKAIGKTRYIGFTGHTQPSAHLRLLDQSGIFDVCQMPVNVADLSYKSFVREILPKLIDRGIGILAMKTLANGGFFGGSEHGEHGNRPKVVPNRISIAEAINFVWSFPISTLISGPDDAAQMQEKIDLAESFSVMDESTRQTLVEQVADIAGQNVEFYKA